MVNQEASITDVQTTGKYAINSHNSVNEQPLFRP